MEKDKVLIVAANGWLGQHLVRELNLDHDDVQLIRTYDFDTPFKSRLDDYKSVLPLESFSEALGASVELRKALKGVTAVFNCVDHQDFSVLPDTDKIHRINSVFVATLAQAVSAESSVKRVVHVSSLLVGASYMAPSVFPTEISTHIPRPFFAVFPDYTRAKQEAEAVWTGFEDLTIFTMRTSFMYGELDENSFIMDVLRYCNNHGGSCPLVNRPHGKSSYSYVGNTACGLIKALRKMRSETVKQGRKEMYNTWDWVEPFAKCRGFTAPPKDVPFYGFYVPWRVVELSSWLLSKVGVRVPEKIRHFPSSGLLYMHFFYWYFWSGVKARLFLDFVPKYGEEEAMERSLKYYKTADLNTLK